MMKLLLFLVIVFIIGYLLKLVYQLGKSKHEPKPELNKQRPSIDELDKKLEKIKGMIAELDLVIPKDIEENELKKVQLLAEQEKITKLKETYN